MQSDFSSLDARIERLLGFWREVGVTLNPGAGPGLLAELEAAISLPLPAEFRTLYSEADGMADEGYDGMLFGLWPIHRILREFVDPEYTAPPGDRSLDFADGLIESHRYAVVLEGKRAGAILVHWHGEDPEVAAPSIGDFASMYVAAPESLYLVPRPGRAGA